MIDEAGHTLFRELIGEASSIVVVTHMNPDGDAVGSESSLARFLRDQGKSVRVINSDPTPPTLAFVWDDGMSAEVHDPGTHDALLDEADLVILVDNAAPDRLGSMEARVTELAGKVLCIDHHPARRVPWRHNIVDVRSCATTAMIHELTAAAGWKADRASAEAIYVGLATDTGFFRFNSATARAYRVAAELIDGGVRPSAVFQRIYERNSVAFTRLLGHALANLVVRLDGELVYVVLQATTLKELGAEQEDTSEIMTALLAIEGVRVAGLFREQGDGRVKVSLRSKGQLDVHGLATEFGGGGHRNASGIVIEGALEDAIDRVTGRATCLLEAPPAEGEQ